MLIFILKRPCCMHLFLSDIAHRSDRYNNRILKWIFKTCIGMFDLLFGPRADQVLFCLIVMRAGHLLSNWPKWILSIWAATRSLLSGSTYIMLWSCMWVAIFQLHVCFVKKIHKALQSTFKLVKFLIKDRLCIVILWPTMYRLIWHMESQEVTWSSSLWCKRFDSDLNSLVFVCV